jgi:aminoglycoside phosphotransferase (APT) family kinase protein
VFTHGDLQIAHVFVDVDEITGVVDWSEAGQGDALFDLASLTPAIAWPSPGTGVFRTGEFIGHRHGRLVHCGRSDSNPLRERSRRR